ncbi:MULTISPECIES: hypothetical protein [unclassified Bradyrhizobium]|uniref:hypothetical protein n=1 Tax=unclassified Bradyrhizobium TaxID=2631580 RepID=UPI0028E90D02|nr:MULTISPECIES: hypothetical protein [unclassified Bradyrhizobium]
MRRLAAISVAITCGFSSDSIASSELRHRANAISFGVGPSLTKCDIAYYFAMQRHECSSTLRYSALRTPDMNPAAIIND